MIAYSGAPKRSRTPQGLAFRRAPDAIICIDQEGTIVDLNPAAESMFGIARDQAVGQSVLAFIAIVDEEMRPTVTALSTVMIGASGSQGARLDLLATRRDGSRFIADVTFVSEPDVDLVLLFLRDIEKTKSAESELRFQKTLLESQSEASIDGILVVSSDNKMLSFNRRFVELWGVPDEIVASRSDEAALGWVIGKLADPDEFLRRVAYLYEHWAEESRDEILLKDGRVFDRFSAPVRSKEGVYYGRIWFFRDITERKQHERRAQYLSEGVDLLSSTLDLEETTAQLAKHAVAGLADWAIVHIVDEEDKLVFGAIAPDRRDRDHTRLRELSESAPFREAVERVRMTEHSLIEPIEPSWHHDGAFAGRSLLHVLVRTRERPLAVLSLVSRGQEPFLRGDQDLCEELASRAAFAVDNARLYQESKRRIRQKEEFLSVASHELKTPLTSLQLQVQSLLRRARRAEEPLEARTMMERLEAADRQVERLATLIDNLLCLSRIDADRLELDLEDVDLSTLVRSVTAEFEDELARTGCTLSLAIEERVVGRWDRVRLEQIVTNLVSNAIKYGDGRPIDVVLQRTPRAAVLVVRDHGIGISPEHHERIFARFERVVSQRNYGGFGLGLWIVKEIVQRLGGTIDVSSTGEGGSTFTVELPMEGTAS